MDEFYTVRGYELKNSQKKEVTSAMEDYLEMIYRISLDNDAIRTNQLSKFLNVKNSSVSKMVKKLGNLHLIDYEKYGTIKLTNEGKTFGSYLLQRHNIIKDFLALIGCQEQLLEEVELIEHIIDDETLRNMAILNNFFVDNKDILTKYNQFKNKERLSN